MDWREALLARGSGLASGRVYWGERPQGDPMPGLVLTSIDDARPQHLKDFDLAPGRIQFDAYGANPAEAWALIEAALAAYVPGGSDNGHRFDRADVSLGPRDLNERIGNETIFRVSMDLTFHHA